jgi:4'-phosphopantetheinyl transferase EntD
MRLGHVFRQPGVVTREAYLSQGHEPLLPEEAAMVRTSVEKRRQEFTASRSCARQALAQIGIANFPLLPDQHRAPIWPASVVGSITHTDGCPKGYCGVAVAERRIAIGLGLDAEPSQPLPRDVWRLVLDELEQRDAQEASSPGIRARLVFSAKETTYKTLFPVFRRFLEFSDVHIDFPPEQGVFFSELVGAARDIGLAETRLVGRFVIDDELLVTGMILPAAGLGLAQEGLSLHHDTC